MSCNKYNKNPNQCKKNNCWYYYDINKCGTNYKLNADVVIVDKMKSSKKNKLRGMKKSSKKKKRSYYITTNRSNKKPSISSISIMFNTLCNNSKRSKRSKFKKKSKHKYL
jgi:hypothetical protein